MKIESNKFKKHNNKYYSIEAEGFNNQITEHTDLSDFVKSKKYWHGFLNGTINTIDGRLYCISKTNLKYGKTLIYRTELNRLRYSINDLRKKNPKVFCFAKHSDHPFFIDGDYGDSNASYLQHLASVAVREGRNANINDETIDTPEFTRSNGKTGKN